MNSQFATPKIAGFGSSIFTEMSRLSNAYGAVNLGQGFPDFPGPDFVKEAAKAAIDCNLNQYAVSFGSPRLRQAVAVTWNRSTGLDIDPDLEVTITSGATEAIFAAIQAIIGEGDELLAFEPFYDSYPASVTMAGGRLIPIRLHTPTWTFDRDQVVRSINRRSKVLLLNTPHNPTGKVFSRDELEWLAGFAIEHDLLVITDEVYERIVFDGAQHLSIATLPGMWERTLTVNSTGKTFSVTGWKIGYAIGPPALNAALRAVHQFVTFASATPFQDAMAHALETAEDRNYYEQLRNEYTARRDLLRTGLHQAGLNTLPMSGSYFLMADVSGMGFTTDTAFCEFLIKAAGVAAVPPSAFYEDPAQAPLLARFCFAKRDDTLIEAKCRLAALPATVGQRSRKGDL